MLGIVSSRVADTQFGKMGDGYMRRALWRRKSFMKRSRNSFTRENTRVVLHFRFATEDAEGKRNILPEFTHPFEIQLQDTKALLFVNGRFSEHYQGIVGAPKVKRFVEDINQLKLKRWQYEKLLAEDGLLEGLLQHRGERARLLTLFEEDKEPFFSPKPPNGWIEYDGLLLSRKVFSW
jgi:hypothetical protein